MITLYSVCNHLSALLGTYIHNSHLSFKKCFCYDKNVSYKIIILAPSAGGKSTLMRYLREHSTLHVVETDEEVLKANNGTWPKDDYKHKVLMPQITNEIISQANIVYLAKEMPDGSLRKARENGFKIIVLKLSLQRLDARNAKRMNEEGYDDASQWFKGQLEHLENLSKLGLVDEYIDGNLPTAEIADKINNLLSVADM